MACSVLRALYWAPASMPQHRAREHAAHPDAASARLQSGSLTAAQRSTSTCGCAAQRSSPGASPCCRSFAQCSVRAVQRQATPRRRPAERVRAASAAMSPAAASEQLKEAASRMLFRKGTARSFPTSFSLCIFSLILAKKKKEKRKGCCQSSFTDLVIDKKIRPMALCAGL